ncbi:MAG: hypothetical protein AB3N24_09035, partial [Leisingera sp.]
AVTLSAEDRRKPGPQHMQDICKAIASANPEAAQTAIKQHIMDAKHTAEKMLAAEPPQAPEKAENSNA